MNIRCIGLACGVAGLCLATDAAFAQSAASVATLGEVVVTATKRAEPLLDVPTAVTAITSDEIFARGLTNYADYLNTVPNVWMQDLGPGQTQLYIRGLVAQGGSGFPVATYFGEAPTSVVTNNGGFANLRLVDVDRVEVLRGPQGTLYGANSLAGVIRVVPAAPNLSDLQLNTDVRGSSTAHSGDLSDHVEGVVNLPIVNDKLAVRLVGYQDHIAGFIDNVVPAASDFDYSAGFGAPGGTLVIPGHAAFTRKDINSEDVWGARAALTWKPLEQLRFDLSFAGQGVTLNSEPVAQQAFGDYTVQRPLDLYSRGLSKEDERIGQLVITYDWRTATLTSATSYTRLTRESHQDISWLAVANGLGQQLWPLFDHSMGESTTEEIRLTSRGNGPVQWLAGYFYSNASNNLGQFVPDYSCPTCLSEVLAGQSFAITTFGDQISAKQKQQSVFGEASYDFSASWTVGVGGRYLRDYIESFGTTADGFLVGGPQAAGPTTGAETSVFNPSAYVRFKPAKHVTLYLEAARGFRSGSTNQLESYDPNGPCAATNSAIGIGPFTQPDKLWTFELGQKSVLAGGKLALNVAIFHQKWTGVQLATDQPCGFNGVVNGGDASGNGGEVEVTARLTTAWSANLSASYVHNTFDTVTPNLGYTAGDRVPGAPEENASAGLQYNFSLANRWGGFARADYAYVGDVHYLFGQGATANAYLQGGYSQANLRFSLQRDHLAIELFARNITDKRAAEATGSPTQGGYTYPLRPRELGLELRYAFDSPR